MKNYFFKLLLLLCLIISCDNTTPINNINKNTYNLSGDWTQSDKNSNGDIINTFNLKITQNANNIEIYDESNDFLSEGTIDDNIINCSDWGGYGISIIEIISNSSLYCTPLIETPSYIEFTKQ